ncbi:hypothetical protein Scep_005768 [Stephania cephalantha]|uniref:Uncharacterized protein n=1 Tax=Stephania cephalantha TaxID=152367 RepID=A0AAP0KY41_9MAGN
MLEVGNWMRRGKMRGSSKSINRKKKKKTGNILAINRGHNPINEREQQSDSSEILVSAVMENEYRS